MASKVWPNRPANIEDWVERNDGGVGLELPPSAPPREPVALLAPPVAREDGLLDGDGVPSVWPNRPANMEDWVERNDGSTCFCARWACWVCLASTACRESSALTWLDFVLEDDEGEAGEGEAGEGEAVGEEVVDLALEDELVFATTLGGGGGGAACLARIPSFITASLPTNSDHPRRPVAWSRSKSPELLSLFL